MKKETKASRLKTLSEIVPVPNFFVIDRGDEFQLDLDEKKRYMVRSSAFEEDTQRVSKAGRFPTIGPVPRTKVKRSIKKIFSDKRVDQVIIQEYADKNEFGVVFCFSKENAFVEYSKHFEGVTSGSINPFVAVFPTELEKYQKLQDQVFSIFEKFGPCDIEFVGIEDPTFVQVRPITRQFEINKELETLKMNLQELPVSSFVENDLCKVIGERSEADGHFVQVYFEALKNVHRKFFHAELEMSEKKIFKIGGQYFMPEEIHAQLSPRFGQLLVASFLYQKEFQRIKRDFETDADLIKLFENNILLAYWYKVNKKSELFKWREKYRAKIDSKLKRNELPSDFHISKKIKSKIELDQKNNTWINVGFSQEDGVVVVPGDFESGPFFFMKGPGQEIPRDVIVLTKQLYPEIGSRIQSIKGIICENGSISSHVSILAREYDTPLMIQTSIKT